MAESQIKGCKGVFGSMGTGAAMGEKDWAGRLVTHIVK
jgi:hypothetical protein